LAQQIIIVETEDYWSLQYLMFSEIRSHCFPAILNRLYTVHDYLLFQKWSRD